MLSTTVSKKRWKPGTYLDLLTTLLRCSGLGTVPKHDGGWRIIYHLSAPPGISINDFIDPNSYTLSYCSVDDAYTIINKLGTGALLSKIDLKNAFQLIPIRQ